MAAPDPPIDAVRKIIDLARAGQWNSKEMYTALLDVAYWVGRTLLESPARPPIFGGQQAWEDVVREAYEQVTDAPVPLRGPLGDALLWKILLIVVDKAIERLEDERIKDILYDVVSWVREKLDDI